MIKPVTPAKAAGVFLLHKKARAPDFSSGVRAHFIDCGHVVHYTLSFFPPFPAKESRPYQTGYAQQAQHRPN